MKAGRPAGTAAERIDRLARRVERWRFSLHARPEADVFDALAHGRRLSAELRSWIGIAGQDGRLHELISKVEEGLEALKRTATHV